MLTPIEKLGSDSGAPRVAVALSTYNGSKYLGELLESVACQDYGELQIFIRDDGSSDATREILEAKRSLGYEVHYGSNVGVAESYFALLELASSYAYIALCDQDDVWKADKISRAVRALQRGSPDKSIPALYCSAYTLVNEDLCELKGNSTLHPSPSFENALIENIATGCTIVLNRPAALLLRGRRPEFCIMHDWWLYLLVSAFGKVVYDPTATLLYRQHSGNVVGVALGFAARWQKRIRLLPQRRFVRRRQAMEFRRLYGGLLDAEKRETLEAFVSCQDSFWKRVRYAFRGVARRQSVVDDLIFRVLLLLNRV